MNKRSSLPEWFQRLEQRGRTVYILQEEMGTISHDRVFSCMEKEKEATLIREKSGISSPIFSVVISVINSLYPQEIASFNQEGDQHE
jgi:hypothetical protein